MVSFSFDDPALSATTLGARLLEDTGMRATFYIAAGLLGGNGPIGAYADWADLARLAARGHDLGCHGFGHLDCAGRAAAEVLADVEANSRAFAEHGLAAAHSYAYPYGEVTAAAKAGLAPRFGLLRGIRPGVIAAGCDLNAAPAVALEGREAEREAARWLDLAVVRRAWVVFYLHDIADSPSPWGCSPTDLAAILARARQSRVEVVTVAQGLARLTGRPPPPHRPGPGTL